MSDDARTATKARYRAERDKRLRPDGNDQYLELVGHLDGGEADPHLPVEARAPRTDDVTVAVVGAGFAGLVTAARLVEAGVTDVCLIDKAGDVGGVWYWNRYPGVQCDTHSFVYLPLLEETGHMPTEKYVHGPEIAEHCRRIATQYGLFERALFHTEVTGLNWDDHAARWIVQTNRGDRLRARYVAVGTGPLHKPKLPGIEGIDTFDGVSFHTSRWDYAYTGGDASGAAMDRLADQRVAVIGTGATAVQCVPRLARDAAELYVFQRTPSSVDERGNRPTDPEWFAREVQGPGWQQRWLDNFCTLQTGGFAEVDLVEDGWTDIALRIRDRVIELAADGLTADTLRQAVEDADFGKMDEIRARVDRIVDDPATADGLKAWYRQLCKRPCFHDEYLQAYNRPTVHLVDTNGAGVERIVPEGVVVAGRTYPVDCIVYASGFEVGTEYHRRAGFDVVGRDGLTLSSYWAEGMRSMHGIHVHGFPNFFVIGASQGANLVSNYTHNLSEAGRTVAVVVAAAEHQQARTVEVTGEAEQAWVDLLLSAGPGIIGGDQTCTPGYYNNEGRDTGERGRLNWAGYPQGPVAFFALLERWRSGGEFEGLDLCP